MNKLLDCDFTGCPALAENRAGPAAAFVMQTDPLGKLF